MPAFPQCPVSVHQTSIMLRNDMDSYTQFRNETDKRIEAVKFNVVYLDQVQDEHRSTGDLLTEHGMKPSGGIANVVWRPSFIDYSQGGGGFIIRPEKILFEDGTTWLAPESGPNPCDYRELSKSRVRSPRY